jgi:hypothetical protein
VPSAAGRRWISAAPGDAVWLAHPHQNLGAFASGLDLRATIDAACRLTTAGRCPRLESIGPWLVPPASELVISLDGRMVAVRPYPTIRILGRIAGWLANNPWLEGGVVRDGEVVRWDGGWWVLDRGFELVADASSDRTFPEAPALIKLATPRAGLPSGVHSVIGSSRALLVGSAAGLPASSGCGRGVIRLEHVPAWLDQGLVVADSVGSLPRFALLGEESELRRLRDDLEPLSRRWREEARPIGRLALASDAELLARLGQPSSKVVLCFDAGGLDAALGELLRSAGELPLLAGKDRRRLTAAADLAAILAPFGVIEWQAEGGAGALSWSQVPRN